MILINSLEERIKIRKRIENFRSLLTKQKQEVEVSCHIFLKSGKNFSVRNGLLKVINKRVFLSVSDGPNKGTYDGNTFASKVKVL